MTRALAAVLALSLALPASARAEVPASTEGRMVDLRAGEAAPFDGALVDAARARVLLERRRAADLASEEAISRATACTGELAECQAGVGSGLKPATVAALVATALAVGVVGGVWLGATASR